MDQQNESLESLQQASPNAAESRAEISSKNLPPASELPIFDPNLHEPAFSDADATEVSFPPSLSELLSRVYKGH